MDEEPRDIHDECAHEIHRLEGEISKYKACIGTILQLCDHQEDVTADQVERYTHLIGERLDRSVDIGNGEITFRFRLIPGGGVQLEVHKLREPVGPNEQFTEDAERDLLGHINILNHAGLVVIDKVMLNIRCAMLGLYPGFGATEEEENDADRGTDADL